MLLRQIAIIDWPNDTAFDFFDIAAVANPLHAQRGQTVRYIDIYVGIAQRAAGVVNAHRLISLEAAIKIFGRRERNLTERHPYIRMLVSGDVNASRIRQVVAAVADRGPSGSIFRAGVNDPSYNRRRIFFCTHSHARKIAWLTSLPSAALPASGSRGSIGFFRRSSQPGGSPALDRE